VGTEVFNLYDVPDPEIAAVTAQDPSFVFNPSVYKGRLGSTADRAQKTLTRFDGRGRTTGVAKRIAKPGAATLADRYTARWYTQTVALDAADRPVRASTGSAVPELRAADGTSDVLTTYTKRGSVKKASSSYGDLVANVTRDADGLIQRIEYGDLAATKTDFSYDVRRRLSSVQTYRGPPAAWSATSSPITPAPDATTTQLLLEDGDFLYDEVDNPVEIRDWRLPNEWPDGAKPVTRKIEYDDLYRVAKVRYQYASGDDHWVSPFAFENGGGADRRLGKPTPHVRFDKRILWQSFEYDWLGNTTRTGDDARGFYDRSLGAITNDVYRLKSAVGEVGSHDGRLDAKYDDAGELVGLVVRRAGPCLPLGATCSQRFAYEWDEAGRLARARRWDAADPGSVDSTWPDQAPAAELRYAYDGTDDRVLKTAVDAQGATVHTVYVFDSLELRRASFIDEEYERTAWTEVPYLYAHGVRLGRVHYASESAPTLASGQRHVFLDLPDHLGSSSIVIDRATGELVERSTYQAFGGTESDYRPARWEGARADHRFTGKEEDVELGLQYFGKRYYAPLVGRWVSADPLEVHQLDADSNLYAYVKGRAFVDTDPVGLDGWFDRARSAAGKVASAVGSSTKAVVLGNLDAAKEAAVATVQGVAAGVQMGAENVDDLGAMTVAVLKGDRETRIARGNAYVDRNVTSVKGAVTGIKDSVKTAGENIGEGAHRALNGDVAGGTQQATKGGVQAARLIINAVTTVQGVGNAMGAGKVTVKPPTRAPAPAKAPAPKAAPAPCATPCFVAGTLVVTATGYVPIELVAVGDEVLSQSDETGELGFRRVDRVIITENRPILRLRLRAIDGAEEELDTTPEHPFWVAGPWRGTYSFTLAPRRRRAATA
jgi:RHS repeat-associated protein